MLHVLALVTHGCVNICGELSPSERAAAMRRFQEGAVRILVATDVLPESWLPLTSFPLASM